MIKGSAVGTPSDTFLDARRRRSHSKQPGVAAGRQNAGVFKQTRPPRTTPAAGRWPDLKATRRRAVRNAPFRSNLSLIFSGPTHARAAAKKKSGARPSRRAAPKQWS